MSRRKRPEPRDTAQATLEALSRQLKRRGAPTPSVELVREFTALYQALQTDTATELSDRLAKVEAVALDAANRARAVERHLELTPGFFTLNGRRESQA